jgi:hypothetical protein
VVGARLQHAAEALARFVKRAAVVQDVAEVEARLDEVRTLAQQLAVQALGVGQAPGLVVRQRRFECGPGK